MEALLVFILEYPGLLENEDLFEVNSWIQEFRFTYLKQLCFITTAGVLAEYKIERGVSDSPVLKNKSTCL